MALTCTFVSIKIVCPSIVDGSVLIACSVVGTGSGLNPLVALAGAPIGGPGSWDAGRLVWSPAFALDVADLAALYERHRDLPGARMERASLDKSLTTAVGGAAHQLGLRPQHLAIRLWYGQVRADRPTLASHLSGWDRKFVGGRSGPSCRADPGVGPAPRGQQDDPGPQPVLVRCLVPVRARLQPCAVRDAQLDPDGSWLRHPRKLHGCHSPLSVPCPPGPGRRTRPGPTQ